MGKSTFAGSARLVGVWVPAFRKTQSKSEYDSVMLKLTVVRNQGVKNGGDQLFHKLVHVLPISNIEFYSAGLIFTVLADEFIKPVLSASYRDDFGAFLDKAVGHCSTDARCGTDHKNTFVLGRHRWSDLSADLMGEN